jgi:glutamate carboxypeptidase
VHDRKISSQQIASEMHTYLSDKLEYYLAALGNLVSINSFSQNKIGIASVAKETEMLFSRLGFSVESVPSISPILGGHSVCSLGKPDAPRIGIVSHHDTVFSAEEEQVNNFHWRPEGNRLYGPGTCDNKGGTIVALMALDALKKVAFEQFDKVLWKVILNGGEELLVQDFATLLKNELPVANSIACFVFEKTSRIKKNGYTVVVSRKGRISGRIIVHGRASHAGNEISQGANAIVQLAHVISNVATWNNPGQDLSVNVGVIKGGSVVNRVPHYAECEFEVRCFSPIVMNEVREKFEKLPDDVTVKAESDKFPCSIAVVIENHQSPWDFLPQTEALFALWRRVGAELGLEIELEKRGGLSDAVHIGNIIPTLDGLGPSGANDHCSERSSLDGGKSKDQEFAERDSLISSAVLHAMSLRQLIIERI